MADDLLTALRSLANRWTMLARDYARASKDSGANTEQAQYNRGYAEGYYKAATELAGVIKEQESKPAQPPQGGRRAPSSPANAPQPAPAAGAQPQQPAAQRPAQPSAPAASRPAAPAAPAVMYASLPVAEAQSILIYGGCQPQVITQNKDNSFRATFSSWGKMRPHEQLNCVKNADPRIIILNTGQLESHDYYIDFALKEN